jgi:hypothetical protein
MKYIGKYGEYRVLACLLENNIEAYPAIRVNQQDYDITAVLPSSKVVRIEVKSTQLNNKSTNNSIDRVDKPYDYLVIVVIDDKTQTSFYVLTKNEAIHAKGKNKGISLTRQKGRKFFVRENISCFKDNWGKIQ